MNRILLTLCAICLIALSCQKELEGDYGIINSGDSTVLLPLFGKWIFEGTSTNSYLEEVVSGAGTTAKTITRVVYNSVQNTGSLTINPDGTMTSENLGYAIDTTAWQILYLDGNFVDSFEIPVINPYVTSSGNANYKIKSTDSIFLYNGSLAGSQDRSMGFKITGNKLSLSTYIAYDTSYSSSGLTGKSSTKQTSVLYFTR